MIIQKKKENAWHLCTIAGCLRDGNVILFEDIAASGQIPERRGYWHTRTHLEDQSVRPRSRKVIGTEVFVAERVFFGDLVSLQLARLTRSAAHMVKLEHGTEDLAHDLRRQLDTERPGDSVPGQVAILGLPIDVDGVRVREHIGLGDR